MWRNVSSLSTPIQLTPITHHIVLLPKRDSPVPPVPTITISTLLTLLGLNHYPRPPHQNLASKKEQPLVAPHHRTLKNFQNLEQGMKQGCHQQWDKRLSMAQSTVIRGDFGPVLG